MTWTTQPRSKGAGDLTYWRTGAGPAVVLIHGVGLRAEAWGAIMPLLAERYTVYAVDMPGHGEAPLKDTQTLRDFAARLTDFVKALDAPVALAGHSMGAILALLVADECPQQVQAVAALNAIFQRTPEAAAAVQARATSLSLEHAVDPSPTLERWFGTQPSGTLAACRDACDDWLRGVNRAGYKAAYQSFANQDGPSTGLLNRLAVPALFMTAEGDRNSTPAMSQKMAGHTPQGRALTLKDAAHMMPMTHPMDTASALMHTFEEADHA